MLLRPGAHGVTGATTAVLLVQQALVSQPAQHAAGGKSVQTGKIPTGCVVYGTGGTGVDQHLGFFIFQRPCVQRAQLSGEHAPAPSAPPVRTGLSPRVREHPSPIQDAARRVAHACPLIRRVWRVRSAAQRTWPRIVCQSDALSRAAASRSERRIEASSRRARASASRSSLERLISST